MTKPMTSVQLQEAVVASYLAGNRVVDIEEEFGIGRSSLYWMLQKSGKFPNRRDRRVASDTTADLVIGGLRELVRLLETRIDELEAENEGLKKSATVRGRADARRSVG